MVEQRQTLGFKTSTYLSELFISCAKRCTILISVPTAHLVPGAACLTTSKMRLVEPLWSAAATVYVRNALSNFGNVAGCEPLVNGAEAIPK